MEYVQVGDYYVPALKVEEESRPIGRWGRLYRTYLQEQHPITFNTLLLSGNLYHRLADINEEATERLDVIIRQMQKVEDITEDLKRKDMMAWVGAMNNIKARAEEIILHEIIYDQEERT